MAEQEKIKLSELLADCLAFEKDPTPANEIKVLEKTQLFVYREYIPMVEKQIQIATIIAAIPGEDDDALAAENWITMGKVVYGLLSYVINLENDLERFGLTPAVIDTLYRNNIIDSILEHCEKDYKRFEKMLDDVINFSNLFRITQTASIIGGDRLEAFIKELRELKQDLSPELLEQLKSLAVAGSPEFAVLKEAVADDAIGKILAGDMALATTEHAEENKSNENEEKNSDSPKEVDA